MNTFKQESEGYTPRVVVKFRDGVEPVQGEGLETLIQSDRLGPWEQLRQQYPGISLQPLYTSVRSTKIQELINRATQLDPGYRPSSFSNYFVINLPPGVEPEALVQALSSWESVQTVYFDPPGDEPFANPEDDPLSVNQGYLNPAPIGIDARYAWRFAGGDGAGLQVIDLERGWTLNHEDLVDQGSVLLHGAIRDGSRAHGTAVLGEIAAVDNTIGCIGITPNLASVDVVSYWESNRPDAILAAIATLSPGDVLLLEAQLNIPGWVNMPIEVLDAEFDAIRLATALGIIVVEAAGNGSNDLDTYTNGAGDAIFNRTASGFRDSGAIMVGAASSTVPHTRLGFSNFGSRIDCYGWGENVTTCSSNDAGATDQYTDFFNGTSSASPIVTGAALAVQGLAQANLGSRFTPQQLRAILSDPALGTASNDPDSDRIGVMPNLKAIIHKLKIHKRPCEIVVPVKLKVPVYVEPVVIEKAAKCLAPNRQY